MTKKLTKKLISIFLSLLMALSLIPTGMITAFAAATVGDCYFCGHSLSSHKTTGDLVIVGDTQVISSCSSCGGQSECVGKTWALAIEGDDNPMNNPEAHECSYTTSTHYMITTNGSNFRCKQYAYDSTREKWFVDSKLKSIANAKFPEGASAGDGKFYIENPESAGNYIECAGDSTPEWVATITSKVDAVAEDSTTVAWGDTMSLKEFLELFGYDSFESFVNDYEDDYVEYSQTGSVYKIEGFTSQGTFKTTITLDANENIASVALNYADAYTLTFTPAPSGPDTSSWPTSYVHDGCQHSGVEHFYATGVIYGNDDGNVEGRLFYDSTSYDDMYDGSPMATAVSSFETNGAEIEGWYYWDGGFYPCSAPAGPTTPEWLDTIVSKVDAVASELVIEDSGYTIALTDSLEELDASTFAELVDSLTNKEYSQADNVYTIEGNWNTEKMCINVTLDSDENVASVNATLADSEGVYTDLTFTPAPAGPTTPKWNYWSYDDYALWYDGNYITQSYSDDDEYIFTCSEHGLVGKIRSEWDVKNFCDHVIDVSSLCDSCAECGHWLRIHDDEWGCMICEGEGTACDGVNKATQCALAKNHSGAHEKYVFPTASAGNLCPDFSVYHDNFYAHMYLVEFKEGGAALVAYYDPQSDDPTRLILGSAGRTSISGARYENVDEENTWYHYNEATDKYDKCSAQGEGSHPAFHKGYSINYNGTQWLYGGSIPVYEGDKVYTAIGDDGNECYGYNDGEKLEYGVGFTSVIVKIDGNTIYFCSDHTGDYGTFCDNCTPPCGLCTECGHPWAKHDPVGDYCSLCPVGDGCFDEILGEECVLESGHTGPCSATAEPATCGKCITCGHAQDKHIQTSCTDCQSGGDCQYKNAYIACTLEKDHTGDCSYEPNWVKVERYGKTFWYDSIAVNIVDDETVYGASCALHGGGYAYYSKTNGNWVFFTTCANIVTEDPNAPAHTHTYATEWTKDATHHWHAATCGHNTEKSDYAQHSYSSEVTTNATCTSAGVTTYTCTCGDTYTDTTAPAALGHSFTNYIPNNNATCTVDGTKTATCDRTGCGVTDTITDEGTATGHSYATTWSSDVNQHWYAATCEHSTEKSSLANHTYGTTGDARFTCTVCSAVSDTKKLEAAKADAKAAIDAYLGESESEDAHVIAENAKMEIESATTIEDVNDIKAKALVDIKDIIAPDFKTLEKDLKYDGTEVKLTKDYTRAPAQSCVVIKAGQKVVVDLNGHKLDGIEDESTFNDPIFIVEEGAELVINDSSDNEGVLTGGKGFYNYQNGYTYGGAILNFGTTTINGGTFTKNSASYGGVIYNDGSGTVIINDGVFAENEADVGGVVASYTQLTINGGVFDNNYADGQGGAVNNGKPGNALITGGTFTNNSSPYGGAVENYRANSLTITGGTFTGNSATSNGGAIDSDQSVLYIGGSAVIKDNTLNGATNNIEFESGTVALADTAFTENAEIGVTITASTNTLIASGATLDTLKALKSDNSTKMFVLDNGAVKIMNIADHTHTGGSATCQAKKICQTCGAEYGDFASHSYTNYASNNDATCTVDGTKTAYCDYECGTSSTITDQGTATGHSFATAWSKNSTKHWHAATCGHNVRSDEANHSYTSEVTTPATCTRDGVRTYTCICGATYRETIRRTGHSFTNYVSDENATCTEDGTLTAICDNGCGATRTIVDEDTSLGHYFTSKVATPATCTEDGLRVYTCNNCGASYSKKIGMLGHSYTKYVSNGDATCTQDGTKTATCDNKCGETDTITDENSKLGHSFTNYVPNLDSACKEDGTMTAVCDNGCGETDTITDVDSKTGHSFTNFVSNNDATCTQDGTKTAVCDNGCGKKKTITDQGTATGHTYTSNVTALATCTEDGTTVYTCHCGDTYSEPITKLGHSYTTKASSQKASDPTCTQASTYYVQCDRCDSVDTTKTVVVGNPNGHIYTSKASSQKASDATCTDSAKYYVQCNNCSSVDTTKVVSVGEALGHSYTNYVSNNDATCIEDGTKTATCDNGCGETNTIIDVDTQTGHSYTNYVSNGDATCTEDGTKTAVCDNGCGETSIITDIDSKTGHNFVNFVSNGDATCTTDGTKTAICENGCEKTLTIVDDETATGHTFVLKATTAPTCTTDGVKVYACSDCEEVYSERIEKLGHSFTNFVSNGNATCTADGTKTAACDNNCGETKTVKDTDSKLGHSFTNYVSNGDATCTADGTKTAACDNGCGEKNTVADANSKKGHSFTNYVSNGDATCTADGTKTAACDNGCGEKNTVADANSKKGHSYTNYVSNGDATCTADGTKTATCDNNCGEKNTVADVNSKKGHTYTSKVTTPATCTADGVTTFTCACGDTYSKPIAKLGHAYTSEVTKAATYTEEGVETYTCANCGDQYTVVIPRIKVTSTVKYDNSTMLDAGFKVTTSTKNISVKWGKVANADGYMVYANYCGNNMTPKLIKTVKGANAKSYSFTKLNGKKIDFNKNFKVYVVAYKVVDGKKVELAKTVMAHVVGGKNKTYTDPTKVTVKNSKVTLAVNKTSTIKATVTYKDANKKRLNDKHAAEKRYRSSNKAVATVDSKGKIKAVGKGTCTVYVFAKNGASAKVTVTVK